MKKNFQLFMFFLFTLLGGLLVYLGNDIIVRFNTLSAKVDSVEKELLALRGALKVVQNFKGIIEKDPKGLVIGEDGKPKPPPQIKPAEGFYCESGSDEVNIIELTEDYKIRGWSVDQRELSIFSRSKPPVAVGSYVIRGSNIYASVKANGIKQNRKFPILKIDDQGYALDLEINGAYLSYDSCTREVQLAY